MSIVTFFNNHLIPGWRNALRLRIIQVHTMITVVAGAVYNLAREYPDMAQQVLAKAPPALFHPATVNVALALWLVIGAYARLAPQPKLPPPPAC